MSLLDNVISNAINNNIIKVENIDINNKNIINQKPKQVSIDDIEKLTEPTIPNTKEDETKPTPSKLIHTIDEPKDANLLAPINIDPTSRILNNNIKDNRKSQETGTLVHNWIVAYFKSLKKFLSDSVDDSIVNFEYNFVSKSLALQKLYNNITHKNPSCIINLDNISPESNLDPIRKNSGIVNRMQTTPLAVNYSRNLEARVDFKFINISQTITLNFDNSTDIINYYDRLTSVYPINHEFISYEYRTLINIHPFTKDWNIDDDTKGIIWDVAIVGKDHYAGDNGLITNNPQRWGEYYCTPQFTIESINQQIDKSSEKYSLQIGLKTFIRVPQTILITGADTAKIKAIQIVMDIGSDDFKNSISQDLTQVDKENDNVEYSSSTIDKPICIDIDRDIYMSHRFHRVFQLVPSMNISTIEKCIYLPASLFSSINNKAAAIYINIDSTIGSPQLYWTELGYLSTDDLSGTNTNYTDIQNKYEIVYMNTEEFLNIGIDLVKNKINLLPDQKLNVIKIPIKNFDEISSTFKQDGPWFDIRLFIFNTTI